MVDKNQKEVTNGLSQRAMTVSLHLSAWRGQRLDRQTTNEVLTERQASLDAGRFEKYLVPPKSLEGVSKAHTRARARHYALTLPWGDEGVRILSSTAFLDYTAMMNQERSACEDAYRAFYEVYPKLRDEAPLRMGTVLYKASDFPDIEAIKSRFGFGLVVMPVPDKDDFRVNIGAEAEAKIRASIEEVVSERFVTAQHDLWSRLLDAVKHFATTMKQDDKVFRDTTVTKLADLAAIAPKLTLAPDPALDAICAEILALTNNSAPSALRDNKTLRQESAKKAEETLRNLEDAMAGAL